MRKPKVLALWVHLLLSANHKERDEMLGGKRITCKPGEFTTGRVQLANEVGIAPTTLERILNCLENEHQIGQRKTTVNRLITIINWNRYQNMDSDSDSKWTASGQRVDTPKECKNVRRIKDPAKKPDFFEDTNDPKRVSLVDVKIGDLQEPGKHKIYNQMVGKFINRGWKSDPEYLKSVFMECAKGVTGRSVHDVYPYFNRALDNYISDNAELLNAQAKIYRNRQPVATGINIKIT